MAAPGTAAAATARDVYDIYGFAVKPEYQELYGRFAGIYASEEAQRSQLWDGYLRDLREAVGEGPPGEDDAALLSRALASLGTAAEAGEAPPQAAALLQRLSSLVQAGLPMPKRGAFWRLFLNVAGKRREGEYARLIAEVEELEQMGSAAVSPAAAPTASKAKASGSAYSMVADASSGAASAAAAAAKSAAAALRRIDTFTLTPLDCDETPNCTPSKPAGSGEASGQAAATAPPLALPGDAPLAGGSAAALGTPASTLQTPLSTTSSSSGGSGSGDPGAAPTPSSTADAGAGDGACSSKGGPGDPAARTAERWRQQDYMSQIDKDLHRTFPGHPCMGDEGRATLRRILSAYARRNTSVGYCQGLNFLAASLMLHMGEEDAFWCLCAVIEDLLGSSYFDERMVLPQVDVLVFGHLLAGRFPTLWRHLSALEVDAASVTMHWFLCCFLNALPLDSTLRVWDLLFFEGSPVVLFRMALALVEIYDQALMCTRESSDAYMLLQCCAQMTFDSSRLVDTACIGFSHLRDAGLHVLRQRYLPTVLENLRTSFPSEDENKGCMTSQQQGTSPHKTGTTTLAGGFADSFQRASSAVLEAEEAAAQHRQQEAAGGSPDSGHVSFRSGRAAGGSRHSSPGSVAGSDGGSQPSSPLVRIRQAVSGLTSRLMPSSLPQLLPSGAVDVAGQELSPMSNGAGTFFRLASPARLTSRPDQPAAAVSAPHLRRISTAGRSGGAASPTAGMGDSAGSGAVLGRRGPGLTPFNEADALLAGSPQQEQQSDSGPAQAAPAFRTPQRAVAPAGLPPHGYASGAPPAAQSQPATPSELLRPPQPPPSHRRAFTFSYPTTEGGHSRRRRRLTIDLLRMANLKPDLHQPALAAAFAIAANPSPRAAGALGRVPAGGSLRGSLGGSRRLGVSPLMQGGAWSADGDGANGIDGTEHLALPVRTLRFDDSDAAVDEDGAEVDGTHGNGEPAVVRRAVTAPPAAWRSDAQGGAPSEGDELPLSQSALWCSSDDGKGGGGSAVGFPFAYPAQDGVMGGQAGPTATAVASMSIATAPSDSSSGSGGNGDPIQAAGPAYPSPPSAGYGGESRQQSRQALLAVVAQLQEEVALAESRRHAAEQEAAAAQQTAQDLQRQLAKVQGQVAAKEAMVAELSAKLESSGGALSDLDGELRATQMAVEVEGQEAERHRRQMAAADALIARLMDAQMARSKGSGSGTSGSSASGAAPAVHSTASSSRYSASPQSSSGSAAAP